MLLIKNPRPGQTLVKKLFMLPAWLAICSHCLLSICIFIHFPFNFKSGVWLSIPPNPVHCFSIT